jgi:alpha-tubulin suppressor-like RCC1 family protein
VAWNVSMVGIKFLSRSGSGSSSDAIKSIAYATKIGVDFTSNSWGGGGSSSSLKRVIEEAGKKGIGFIAAAGNHNGNNDSRPSYPASYDLDNIIAVGANDHNGKKADFSCYGKNSVDLFAPGVNIYSTVPGNKYASYQGTSMATPQVAGAYALVQSLNLDWTCKQIKEALMSSTDTESSLKDRCVTGGRLNAFKALQAEPAKERLIAAKPTKVDFGKVAANQNKTLEFTLGNSGTSDTTISKVFIAGGNFRSKDLIASWPLNGNAKDSSGNGHDGKVVNATLTSDRFGRSNQAYSFDGTGDYIEIPHNQSFNCLPITISVWFKSESVKAGGVVGKYVSGAWNGWLVHQYNDAIVPWYLRSTTRRVIGKYGEDPFESKITRSKWNHVVSVFNEKEGRLYLNGVHKDTHPWTGTPGTPTSSYTINIGRYPSSGSTQYDFTGSIDDVRIYETAMGADEVIELYEENTAGKFFTVDLKTPIVIKPKNFQTGKVTFQSSEQGLKQAEIIVLSDAKNAPRLVIPLSAEITTTPDLVVNPESMHFDLNENETKTQALTLSNKGDGELTYQVSVLGTSGNPSKKTEVFGMGYNFHGQLGDGTRTNRYKPVQSILAATESIAAGGYHNLFLKKDDSLWATGYNYWGELGDGTRSTRYKPVQILSGGVQAIAGGGYHTLILKNDGSLWATGYNHYGQLGDGTTTMRLKPVQILSGGVQAIAAGYYHSLFIKKDGSLWTMGRNSWGALGDGSSTHRSKPVQILSGGVRNVDGGAFHSLFVKNDDSLWAMGRNYYGELGDGTRSTRTKPALIMSGGVETVASRLGYHSLVLKKDHSLWAMGRNNYGQLGDGSTSDRTKPVRVIAGDVQKIAAGYNHSLVLKKDGSLWAMGYNYYGQLGDGTRTQRLKPVRVMAGGVGEISGGGQHSLFLKGEGNGEAPQWLTIGDSQGEKGLVASYPFDGDAKDVSGNQNHATLNGPTFRPDRNQKTNGALYFDGVNDRVVIPTNKNISTNFSVQFWAKPERTNYIGSESDSGMPGLGQRVAVLNAHHGGRDSKIAGLGITLGANGYATYQHAHYLYSTTLAYPANLANWNHFTTICRDNRVELYLNRKLVKTGIKLNRPNFLSSVASLGTCPSWGPHYKGYLDEFKVYDRALTADDVRSQKSKGNNNGSLPAGKSIAINVSANASKMPTEHEEAHILISSNDPDEPQKKIKVTAQKLSENAGLVFRPSSLSFENTYVGQTAEKALILSNAGTKELTVNQFVFRDSAFSHRLSVPFTLKPGEKRDATIYFTPQSAGKVVSSALVLTNEDGGKTRTFQISGEGSLAPVMVITPPSLSATLKPPDLDTQGSHHGWRQIPLRSLLRPISFHAHGKRLSGQPRGDADINPWWWPRLARIQMDGFKGCSGPRSPVEGHFQDRQALERSIQGG